MKTILVIKFTLLSFIVFLNNLSARAQNNNDYTKAVFIGDIKAKDPTKSLADNFIDNATRARIFIDDSLICMLPKQRYSTLDIPIGQHKFSAQPFGKKKRHNDGVSLDVQAGINYCFEVYGRDNDVYLVRVTEDFAQKIIANLKVTNDCNVH